MERKYYGIDLFEVGESRREVIDLLASWYKDAKRSEIAEMIDEVMENGGGSIIDCLSEEQAEHYELKLITCGADAEKYEMSEDEIESAIESGDIILEDNRSIEEKDEEDLTPSEKYQLLREQMWDYMKFCIGGWAVATVGFSMMAFENMLGLLFILVGVIIVDIPSFKLLAGGFGLGSLFAASGAVYEITYSDGRKQMDYSEQNMGYVLAIITYVITLFIGIIAMLVKIFKCFFEALAVQKDNELVIEFKDSIFLPPVIGVGVFVVGLIVTMVAGGVAEYQYTHPEDLSKEEIKTLILNAKTKMETSAWSYYLVDWHYEEETSVADYHTKVVHNADNSYVVTLSGSSDEIHSIKNGVYKWSNNSWTEYTNNQSTPTTYGEKLDTFLLHNLIDFDKMLLDENNLFAGNSYNGYYLYWHRNPLEGGTQKIELLSNCHIDRIVDSNLYGYTITFHEDTNFGGYIR